jgi:hypothetical protein
MATPRTGTFLLGCAILGILCSSLSARQIEDWPYDKLFKQADLVVIVKPLAVRDASKEDQAIPPKGHSNLLTGLVTTFEVLQVVKGECKQKKMELVHFRLKAGVKVSDGPLLVSFHTKARDLSGKGRAGWFRSDYMLFLKKKGGRFEPVSGQFDPGLSVKQMMEPLP